MAHAYLLCGLAGGGLRRAALAFAAALLCPGGGCGSCETCRRVSHLAHPDVDVIEPSGMQLVVDQVREAIREAWRAPVAAGRRVVVVDQADRMNPNAQNAFLKALEEPPPSTVIVLVAPSAESLAETVRSRCRLVTLSPPSQEEVARSLVAEGLPAAEARLWARVGGSLERAWELAFDAEAQERRRRLVEAVCTPARDPGDALETAEWLAASTKAIRDRVAAAHRALAHEQGDWLRGGRRDAEERLRREQRRAEQDALEAALDMVSAALRDVLALAADPQAEVLNEDLRAKLAARAERLRARPGAVADALGAVEEARRRLRVNANVLLTLERALIAIHEHLDAPA